MNEQEVRALVREAIERHLGRPREGARADPYPSPLARFPSASAAHPSHIQLNVLSGSDEGEGMCVIEPAVRCTHCGFCQSYGH